MGVIFRATANFMDQVRDDLRRPHDFAYERVGFIAVRAAQGVDDLVLLAEDYWPVDDADYLRDPTVGAMMGAAAIRKAMQVALQRRVGIFHVHMHERDARLWFSPTDLREQLKFVPDFFNVREDMPHGAIVFGPSEARGRIWKSADDVGTISEFNIVGAQAAIRRAPIDGLDFEA